MSVVLHKCWIKVGPPPPSGYVMCACELNRDHDDTEMEG